MMGILSEIKSYCIDAVLSLAVWKDIVLLVLGAVLPPIVSNIYHNIQHNRQIRIDRRGNDRKAVGPWVMLLAVLGTFLVGYIYIGYAYVKIPDVIGTDHQYAERALSAAGLKYNSFYGRDGDIVLSIGNETYAKKGTGIELVYGRKNVLENDESAAMEDGRDMAPMPDMYLVTEYAAYMYLTARGFRNIEVLEQYHDDMSQGYVIKTEPKAGDMISLEDTITLYVTINQDE